MKDNIRISWTVDWSINTLVSIGGKNIVLNYIKMSIQKINELLFLFWAEQINMN